MELTQKQEQAIKIVTQKYAAGDRYAVISGYAGTGKSTVIKFLIEKFIESGIVSEDEVGYACYTGKACQVLTAKGHRNVQTLHKLLYTTHPTKDGGFVSVPNTSIDYRFIVVDECSMAPTKLVNLLLSFPVFVVFLGDPFQLPPVKDSDNNHLLDHPDIFLDEIMRQAKDSGIIQLSMKIRNGESYKGFNFGGALVLPRREFVEGCLSWADIVISATHKTRVSINRQVRAMQGRSGIITEGEKLICCSNYWETIGDMGNALTNGCVGFINDCQEVNLRIPAKVGYKDPSVPVITGYFTSEIDEAYNRKFYIDKQCIETGTPALDNRQKYIMGKLKMPHKIPLEFTYGYAITCHKAQGSQWNNVLVLEETFPFGTEDHRRWLYTACTRAIDKVVIIEKS